MKSKSKNRKVLDLHGRTRDEIDDLVDHFLFVESQKKTSQVAIMTGKGKGIVQKAVIDYLRKSHYPWTFDKLSNGKPNEGVLIIYLD